MPGATSLGIPYPLQGEPVNATSWQNLATAVDGLMTQLDVIRDLAVSRPSATMQQGGGGTVMATGVTTTLTPFAGTVWDNGGFVSLAPAQFNVPPGVYWVSVGGALVSGFTTITTARLAISTPGFVWASQTITGGSVLPGTQALVFCNGATTAISFQAQWQGTGGPATVAFATAQIVKIRALADL